MGNFRAEKLVVEMERNVCFLLGMAEICMNHAAGGAPVRDREVGGYMFVQFHELVFVGGISIVNGC